MVIVLAAFAHATRLAAYRLLSASGDAGMAAGEIAEGLSIAPNTLSSHLAILSRAGVVSQRRSGRMIIYRARGDTAREVAEALVAL